MIEEDSKTLDVSAFTVKNDELSRNVDTKTKEPPFSDEDVDNRNTAAFKESIGAL